MTNEQTDGILLDLIRYAINIGTVAGGLALVIILLYIMIDRAHPSVEVLVTEAPTVAEASEAGTEAPAGSEEAAAVELDPALVAAGAELFVNQGCTACHVIEGMAGAVGVVGPNLTKIGITAEERAAAAGVADAAAYMRQSIIEPNAFIVPECPTGACVPGMMTQTFGQTLSEEQVDALVQFLLLQKGGG